MPNYLSLGCNPCTSNYSRLVVLFSAFHAPSHFLPCPLVNLITSMEIVTHSIGREGYWGIRLLGRKASRFTDWISALWLMKQWVNVQSKLCKRVWVHLAPLAQTRPHRWKLFLLDGSVLEATWKYVGLLVVLRWVCEDLYLAVVPASSTKAFTHEDVVYMYTHTHTQMHTHGARDVLLIVFRNSADVITNMFILALILGRLTLPCCWTGKKRAFVSLTMLASCWPRKRRH